MTTESVSDAGQTSQSEPDTASTGVAAAPDGDST